MGNLLVRSVSGCLPFVGQGVEVDLQPVGFGDSWPKGDGLLRSARAWKAAIHRCSAVVQLRPHLPDIACVINSLVPTSWP